MKLFKYKEFLINESIIELDDTSYNDFQIMREIYKDDSFREIITDIISISYDKIDIESNKLNKDKYVIKMSTDVGKISVGDNQVKIGRFIKIILPDLKDHDVENFVNKYKSFQADKYLGNNFILVSGKDIERYYTMSYDDIDQDQGSSNLDSCMVNQDCGVYEFYEKNENIQLLILKDKKGKLIGRSLIWKDTKGNYIMDRIYSIDDYIIDIFRMYARNNGWYYRATIAAGNKYLSNSKGERVNEFKPQIRLSHYKLIEQLNLYPFLDTFPYLNLTKGLISNFDIWKKRDSVIRLQGENGTFSDVRNLFKFLLPVFESVNYLEKVIDNIDIYYYSMGFEIFTILLDKEKINDEYFEFRRKEILNNFNNEINIDYVDEYIIGLREFLGDEKESNEILKIDYTNGIKNRLTEIQNHFDFNVIESVIKFNIKKELELDKAIRPFIMKMVRKSNNITYKTILEYTQPFFIESNRGLIENLKMLPDILLLFLLRFGGEK